MRIDVNESLQHFSMVPSAEIHSCVTLLLQFNNVERGNVGPGAPPVPHVGQRKSIGKRNQVAKYMYIYELNCL